MDVAYWLEAYGYWAVFFAGMLEGELVQVLGGIAAKAGHLGWTEAWLLGTLGTFVATQCWFFAGRFAGDRVLARRPGLQPRVDRARLLLEKHGLWLFVF